MAKRKKINTWKELVSFLETLPDVDLACRGQDREYRTNNRRIEMKPKIDRCLSCPDIKYRLRMERALCQRFREHAPTHLSEVERCYLQTRWLQLVVMQHYGAPTRLLDWTKSALVAVYFAVSGSWQMDGYVYGFRRDLLESDIRTAFASDLQKLVWGPHPNDRSFSDPDWDLAPANDLLFEPQRVVQLSPWVATFYSRQAHFPRLVAQQGFFTFASKPDLDHWQFIDGRLGDACFILRIDSAAKAHILRRLNGVGLNGATLFPGPDGIGRSMEGFARAWGLDTKPSQF